MKILKILITMVVLSVIMVGAFVVMSGSADAAYDRKVVDNGTMNNLVDYRANNFNATYGLLGGKHLTVGANAIDTTYTANIQGSLLVTGLATFSGGTSIAGDTNLNITRIEGKATLNGSNNWAYDLTISGDGVNDYISLWTFTEDGDVFDRNATSGNDGTVTGATFTASGKFGGAYDFTGGGADDNIKVTGADIFLSQQGSVCAWFNLDSLGATQVVISNGDTASADRFFVPLRINASNTIGIALRNGGAGTEVSIMAVDTIFTTGIWNHVCSISDGSSYKIFINGISQRLDVLIGSNSGDWSADIANIDHFTIGAYENSGGVTDDFAGRIDEPAIWYRALTPSEVLYLYNTNAYNRTADDATSATFGSGAFIPDNKYIEFGTNRTCSQGYNSANGTLNISCKTTFENDVDILGKLTVSAGTSSFSNEVQFLDEIDVIKNTELNLTTINKGIIMAVNTSDTNFAVNQTWDATNNSANITFDKAKGRIVIDASVEITGVTFADDGIKISEGLVNQTPGEPVYIGEDLLVGGNILGGGLSVIKDFNPDDFFLAGVGAGTVVEWFTGKADVVALDADTNESLGFSYIQPSTGTSTILLGWSVNGVPLSITTIVDDFDDNDVSDFSRVSVDGTNESASTEASADEGTLKWEDNNAGALYRSIIQNASEATIADPDITVSLSLEDSGGNNKAGDAGIIMRYINTSAYVGVFVNTVGAGSLLRIFYENGGGFTVYTTGDAPTLGGVWYKLRVQLIDTTMKIKFWNNASAEPGTWNATVTEANHTDSAGQAGLFVTANINILGQVNFDDWRTTVVDNVSVVHMAMDYNCTTNGAALDAPGDRQSGTVETQTIIALDANKKFNQTSFAIPSCTDTDGVDVTFRRGATLSDDTWDKDFGILWARSKIG